MELESHSFFLLTISSKGVISLLRHQMDPAASPKDEPMDPAPDTTTNVPPDETATAQTLLEPKPESSSSSASSAAAPDQSQQDQLEPDVPEPEQPKASKAPIVSLKTQDLDWRVMKTSRGGFRVIVDDFMFIDQKVMRQPDQIRFTCSERKPSNCRCAVVMSKDHKKFIRLDQTHNHPPPDLSYFGELFDLDTPLPISQRRSRSRRTTENTIESDRSRFQSESMMDLDDDDEDQEEIVEVPGPSEPLLSDDVVTLIFHQMTHEERIRAKAVSRYFNHISKQFLPTPNFKLNAELYISPTKRGPARYTFKAYNEQRCFNGLFPNRPESWPSFLRIVSFNVTTSPTDGRGAINPDDVQVICTMLKHRAMWGISTLSMFNVDLIHVSFELSETFFSHLMRANILKLTKVVNICEDFGLILEHYGMLSPRLQCVECVNCLMVEPEPFDNDLVMKCLRRKMPIQMDLSSFEFECGTKELIAMMLDLINRDPGLKENPSEERSMIICPHRRINLAEVAHELGTAFEDDSFMCARAADNIYYVVKVSIITELQLRFSARCVTKHDFEQFLSPAKAHSSNA
ncbi:hypothetical protein L596_025068 [Steinernema carpocapsae]|uniref:FLYWCH-type domain-containing protein n=1 Tax=Steinernema carpocapsae TaxID=34508 RepID=A0A4U5M6Q3_STECR|nr:hypothetical protein L596_025068 [Steinernema carpocapsae]